MTIKTDIQWDWELPPTPNDLPISQSVAAQARVLMGRRGDDRTSAFDLAHTFGGAYIKHSEGYMCGVVFADGSKDMVGIDRTCRKAITTGVRQLVSR